MNRMHTEECLIVAQQAAEWLEMLPTATLQQRTDFSKWLQSSPLHVREFLAAIMLREELRRLDPERRINVEEFVARSQSNVTPVTEQGRGDRPPRSAFSQAQFYGLAGVRQSGAMSRLNRGLLAIAFMVFTGLLVFVYLTWGISSDRIVTRAAEWKTIKLADGSTGRVAPHSQLRVDFSNHQRTIYFILGEATFVVAQHRDRPFVVETPLGSVRALGTIFNIHRLSADELIVTVTEGSVVVTMRADLNRAPSSIPPRAEVTAGRRIAIACGSALPARKRKRDHAVYVTRCGWLFLGGHPQGKMADGSMIAARWSCSSVSGPLLSSVAR